MTPNLNEIRDYKYVDKTELQEMFDDPSEHSRYINAAGAAADRTSV